MNKGEIFHHSHGAIFSRNVDYKTRASVNDIINIMERKPDEFKEWFIHNPLGFLKCCNDHPKESYAFVRMNQDFFNNSNWLNKSNIKDVMNFARENPKFFSLVLMPWIKKNLGKVSGLLHDVPEFKETLKYDFPIQFKEIIEMINPKTLNISSH